MRDEILELVATRLRNRDAIAAAAAARERPAGPVGQEGRAVIVAADHPARGAVRAGGRADAMADRADLLERLSAALAIEGVTGVLAAADVIEDLLLLGVLEGKAVFGSMNRGGIAGATWEIDDRFTAYDGATLESMGFEGGKMLMRIDVEDAATAAALEGSARAVTDLANHGLVAMIEPFMCRRVEGRLTNELTTEAAITASVIAAGLGTTSAYTWLKVPVVAEMDRVVAATTLPTVLLGGDLRDDQDRYFESWRTALAAPNVIGTVVGRSLLYPADDDVAGAVATIIGLFPETAAA